MIVNILDKLPKVVQPYAKELLHEINQELRKESALSSLKKFGDLRRANYPKAVEYPEKDQEKLLRYMSYPAENWQHIWTTNPIESSFAGVRNRTKLTKGCGSRQAAMAMVYQ
jgi:putative transposase